MQVEEIFPGSWLCRVVWPDSAVDADDGYTGNRKRRSCYDQMGKCLNFLVNLFVVKDSIGSGWVAGCVARGKGFPSYLGGLQPPCH